MCQGCDICFILPGQSSDYDDDDDYSLLPNTDTCGLSGVLIKKKAIGGRSADLSKLTCTVFHFILHKQGTNTHNIKELSGKSAIVQNGSFCKDSFFRCIEMCVIVLVSLWILLYGEITAVFGTR